MNSLNDLNNKIDYWNQPTQTFFTHHVKTRAANVFAGAPLGLVAVAQNALQATAQSVGAVIKLPVRIFSIITKAACLRQLDQKLPALKDFFETVKRVIAHALGAFASATLGFVSPSLNFKLQVCLGVVVSNTNDLQKMTILDEEALKLTQEIKKLRENKEKAILAKQEADVKKAEQQAAERQLEETCEAVLNAAREIDAKAIDADIPVSEAVKELFSNAETETQAAADVISKDVAEIKAFIDADSADEIALVEAEIQREIDEEAAQTQHKVCDLGNSILNGLSTVGGGLKSGAIYLANIPVKLVTVPYNFFAQKNAAAQV